MHTKLFPVLLAAALLVRCSSANPGSNSDDDTTLDPIGDVAAEVVEADAAGDTDASDAVAEDTAPVDVTQEDVSTEDTSVDDAALDDTVTDDAALDAVEEDAAVDDTSADTSADTNTEDTGADVVEDTTDTSADTAPDCGYTEIGTNIVWCSDTYRYVSSLESAERDCPPVVRIQGSDADYADVAAAISGEACDDSCLWRLNTSVTWLRCGVSGGYIQFTADGCPDLYELPEGLFTSLDDYDDAHPCPDVRPAGQCVTNDDCPGISSCQASAPGGICATCGTIADCPDAADECSAFGACAITCDDDDECPRGQNCTRTNVCRISACVDGSCPDPAFGCNSSDLCERVACDDSDTCLGGSTCVSGRCVVLP